MHAFMEILDLELQQLNSDYEAKRFKNITLNPPLVHIARENLFYDWLKKKETRRTAQGPSIVE